MNIRILILFSFLHVVSFSCATIVSDYCVGDLSQPNGPAGYLCKDPAKVTIDDFVYSGLKVAANSANPFKLGVNNASVNQFPALNGMGISMSRADLEVGGVVPLHSHRVAELKIIMKGTIIAGFIDSKNIAYYKTLTKGDIMIFSPTLLHFQINVGSTPALAYGCLASENPGIQTLDLALFQSTLPSKLIEDITLLDNAQVNKLKKLFGGMH